MTYYCPKCGSTEHPVGRCPSLTNPDFPRQQAERIHAAGAAAADHASSGNAISPGSCLLILLVWMLSACTVVLSLIAALMAALA